MSKLKILTLNWNGKDKLDKLYPSLIKSMSGIVFEWIIKDNASTDGSIELIKSWGNKNIRLIEYPHNRDSFSYGCNYLFNEANPADDDFVLLLNNDIVIRDKSSIKNMMLLFNDNEVGVVGAKLTFADTGKVCHAGVCFSSINGMPYHFGDNECASKFKNNTEFQSVTGAVMLTKAKHYRATNTDNASGLPGLNERLLWAFDDIDFTLSVKYDLNKKIVCCYNTSITHEQSATLKKNPVNKLFMPNNIRTFKGRWAGRIAIDEQMYKIANHNVYKVNK